MADRIGFVGVGRMGSNMARRLKEQGYEVTAVYDVNAAGAQALAQELAAAWGTRARPKQRVAIIGAGGAALAALVACRRLGFQLVFMTSRSWSSTELVFDAPTAKLEGLPLRGVAMQIASPQNTDEYLKAIDQIAATGADTVEFVVSARMEHGRRVAGTRNALDPFRRQSGERTRAGRRRGDLQKISEDQAAHR